MRKLVVISVLGFILVGEASASPTATTTDSENYYVQPRRQKFKKSHRIIGTRLVVGTRVQRLPSSWITFTFNNIPYIYAGGVYYQEVSSSEYVVVKPEKGMLVPSLPDYNVEKVEIKGETLFRFENTLYKQVPTSEGVQYQVVGFLDI